MVTSPKLVRRIPRQARRTAAVITASLLTSGFSMANAIAETPQPGNDAIEVTKQDNMPHQTADNSGESKQVTTDAATEPPDNHAGMTSTSEPTSESPASGQKPDAGQAQAGTEGAKEPAASETAGETKTNSSPECLPDSGRTPVPEIVGGITADNTIHIKGKDYCNAKGGGAKIAIKVDGKNTHRLQPLPIPWDPNSDKKGDDTIWFLAEAKNNGDLDINMPLPNGTTTGENGTKEGVFEDGRHVIQVLSGSLQDDDPVSRVELTFVKGKYHPLWAPGKAIANSKFTPENQTVVAAQDGGKMKVTVSTGQPGDWVYAIPYVENKTVENKTVWKKREWWPTGKNGWHQLDANKQFTIQDTSKVEAGTFRLAVVNGNENKYGEFIGWTPFRFEGSSSDKAGNQSSGNSPQDIDKSLKDVNSQIKKVDTAFDGMLKSMGLGAAGSGGSNNAKKSTTPTTTPPSNNPDAGNNTNNATAGESSKKKKSKKKTTTTTSASGGNATVGRATTTGGVRTAATTRSGGTVAGGAKPVTASSSSATRTTSGNSAGSPNSTGSNNSGGSTNTNNGSSASSKPQPKNTPKPPVKSRDQLTKKNVFGVTGKLKKEVLTMKIPKLKAGDWAYLYVYSADTSQKPVGVSWIQVDSTGAVKLDTKDLPDGEYTVAAVDEKGDLVGWVDVKLGDIKNAAVSDGDEESDDEIVAAQVGMMGAADWWLIGISVLIPFATAGVIYVFHRSRRSN